MKALRLHTLTGQLIAIMLLALAASFAIAYFLSHRERESAIFQLRREDCISRTASIASLLLHSDPALHADVARSISSPWNRFWITDRPPADPVEWQQTARENLLAVRVRADPSAKQKIAAEPRPLFHAEGLPDTPADWEDTTITQRGETFAYKFVELHPWNGMGMVLQLGQGSYLNAVSAKPREMEQGGGALVAAFAVSALTLSLASVLIARRVGRPLRRLTEIAERVGRGDDANTLPPDGPEDIRATAVALTTMQSRIRRFVEDRTNMLAAISHDLRTPITSLRLRAEFINDDDTRDRIIAALEELQRMIDATLLFAREESVSADTRPIELDSLVASICDDAQEMGATVEFQDSPRIVQRCRPEALKRAVRNIIENAARYGTRAHVRLEQSPQHIDIIVEDHGPGIPVADHERVFAPFVRLESSRNRDTGGVGLGLSIARTIVHAHGGEVLLTNRDTGGLRVTIRLPRSN